MIKAVVAFSVANLSLAKVVRFSGSSVCSSIVNKDFEYLPHNLYFFVGVFFFS